MPDYAPIADLLNILHGFEKQLVGSTAINGQGEDIDIAVRIHDLRPAPITAQTPITDIPNIVLLNNQRRFQLNSLITRLRDAGCEMQGGAHYEAINAEADDQFTSFKRGNFNLLLCFNDRSWTRFTVGRDFCILLRELGVDMTSKAVRVACHGMANHGNIDMVRADLERLRVR